MKRAGFTLAEVAVTLVIVGFGLVLVLDGINRAKVSAAQTHYRKVARDLALVTLGELESGLFWEELDGQGGDLLSGTYAEEGYEDWHWEIALGEEGFTTTGQAPGEDGYFDTWQAEREREERARDAADEDQNDEAAQPFEKVRIQVTYPRMGDRPNELVLERWIPWEQVYGTAGGESGAPADGEEPPE